MPTGSISPSLHQTPRQTVARQTSRLTSKFASRPPLPRRTTGNNEFSPLALESTPWPAVARRPTTTSRRPTTLLSLQPPEVPPPVAHGSYSNASHTVLQHWLWRFLKQQTESFTSLHNVFSKSRPRSPIHTFAAILQNNYVSPHQVILDAGPALMQAAAKYPEEPPSDDDSA